MNLWYIMLAIVPGLAWLIFYLREDLHPEPKRLIFLVFVVGGLSAVAALIIQNAIAKATGLDILSSTAFIIFLIMAFTEEVSKFFGAYIPIHKNKEFNEPIDAMLYMIIAAMGFATVENIGVIMGMVDSKFVMNQILEAISFRFVGATLLHALCSGIVGYYWAIDIRDFFAKKFLLLGIITASILHAIFNYFIIVYGNLLYALIYLIIIGIFVFSDFEKLKYKKV